MEMLSLRATAAGQTPNLNLQNVEAMQMTAQLPATSGDTTRKKLLKVCCIIEFNSMHFRCSALLVLFGFNSSDRKKRLSAKHHSCLLAEALCRRFLDPSSRGLLACKGMVDKHDIVI